MAEVEPSTQVGATENHYLLRCLDQTPRGVPSEEPQSLQPLRLTLLDVNDLIRRIAPRLRRILRKERTLVLTLGPDVGLTVADAKQLAEALIALTLKARRVMAADGTLAIATKNVLSVPPGAVRSIAPSTALLGFVSIETHHTDSRGTPPTIYLPRVL